MTDSIVLPLADTSDMIEMHRVFRKCFAQAASLVTAVRAGDVNQVAVVASYFANVLRLVRVHHEGEDTLVTPKLLERKPGQADLIERIASQHTDVIALIDSAEDRLTAWQDAPDGPARAELTGASSASASSWPLTSTPRKPKSCPSPPVV